MKSIPTQLLSDLKQSVRSCCFHIKIVSRQTGVAYGFTTLDAAQRFNDGEHDLWYLPTNVLRPQNIQSTSDMDVDNSELHGWFDDLIENVADAGLLDGGEVTVYRVNFLRIDHGAEVVAYGSIGKIEFAKSPQTSRKIEFLGLDNFLKVSKNPLYSLSCRNTFGDKNCGKTLSWSSVATITAIQDQFLLVQVSGVTAPAGTYNFGVIRFKTGDNANVELEVEEWLADGWVRLSFVPPYPMKIGDTADFREDCDKMADTCITKYSNILFFNGEHLIPVQDQSLMVPGAYIKTQGAK